MKRIFCVLLALCLCLGACPLIAAAETAIRDGCLDLSQMTEITENDAEGWKWEPDDNGGTLTLTNCHIMGGKTYMATRDEQIRAIYFPEDKADYKLVLEGDNIIEATFVHYDSFISNVSNTMNLTITGSGSLTAIVPTGYQPEFNPYIVAGTSLTIEDSVTIRSNVELCTINKNFTMNGGTVTLEGDYVNFGIYVNAGDVIINDGNLTINAKTAGMFLPGIPPTTRTNNVKISGGTVKIDAGAGWVIYSAYVAATNQSDATDNLEITGGNVQFTSRIHVRKINIEKDANLTLNTAAGLTASADNNIGAKLASGTYTGSTAAIQIDDSVDLTLANLLEEGYAFYKGSVSQANLVTDTTGKTLTGTIVVAECVHTPLTSNKNGTHGGKCTACSKKFENADCEYEFTTSGNVHTGVCTVCGSTLQITADGMDGLVYSGTEQLPTVATTLDGTELENAAYKVTVSGKDAGNVTATIEGTGTCKFKKELTYAIASKPLTVPSATTANRNYDGTNEVEITGVTLDGIVSGDTVSVDTSGLKGTIPGVNAGTYDKVTLPTLTLTGAQAGNYTLAQPSGAVSTSVTISKAAYNGTKSATSSTKYGTSGTCVLTALLQGIDGAMLGTPAATDNDNVFSGEPFISDNSLSYTLGNVEPNKTGTIKVKVSSTNYEDFDLTITVQVTDKDIPVLTISPITADYTGEPVPDSAIQSTATVNGQTISGTWSFIVGQDLTNVAHSGTKTVKFTPENKDDYAEAEGLVTVTINKASPSGNPTYTAITESGKTLSNANLVAPEGWPAGTLSWKDADTTGITANTAYNWTFIPNDTANYNSLSGSVTLWVQSSGSSGGGSQSSLSVSTTGQNSSSVTTTTTAVPTASVQGGEATVSVDAAMGNEIVRQTVANKSENVTIAPKVTGSVTKAEVSVPAATMGQIGSQTSASLTISTPVANVTIPNSGLGSLSNVGGNITVSTEKTGNTVEVTVMAGGKTVDSIPGGLTLTVPMANTTPGTVAVLVHEDGTREVVRKSVADSGSVTIPLDGSAKLEIVDNSKPFSDVPAGSWMADAVAFTSAHKLFNGTGRGPFSPNRPMSRGMLAVVLHNLENNPEQAFSGLFNDVGGGEWYAEGIAWAAVNGIVSGYGNGQFGPNNNITREQLAVMLWRYAGSPAAAGKELVFSDADAISDYALEAMRWAVENGILNGYGDGLLDPQGLATRAQVAQILKNYMNL